MLQLHEYLGRSIQVEPKKRRDPVVRAVVSEIAIPNDAKQGRIYQCEVLNFFHLNREKLAIDEVFEFENIGIDGGLLLSTGKRIAVEVKYRMNWQKALEATYELKKFLRSTAASSFPVSGAIIVFDDFQGSGWHCKPACRLLQNGWNEWYRNFSVLDGVGCVDLLRLRDKQLGDYEGELRMAEIIDAYASLSD